MMYFNNVHILMYVFIALVGIIVGRITGWCNIRLPEKKKILSIDFFKEKNKGNYFFPLVIPIIYICLVYQLGIKKDDMLRNIELIKFLILSTLIWLKTIC